MLFGGFMHISRETKISNLICLAIIIVSCIIRAISYKMPFYTEANSIIAFLYITAIIIWLRQVNRRIIQKEVRKNIVRVGEYMIFWMALRMVRYIYVPSDNFLIRYSWYLYYIPLLFIGVFIFLSALHIGKTENEKIDKRWELLYIPSTILALLVLTNDFHQLAFYFKTGLNNWSYTYMNFGIIYFLSMSYIWILLILSIVICFIRCSIIGRRKQVWVPLIPVVLGASYNILKFIYREDYLLFSLIKTPEISALTFAGFIECLILTHLIPSNDSYEDFMQMSSLKAGIMDFEGEKHFVYPEKIEITKKLVEEAKTKQVYLDENTLLESFDVIGGTTYWTKDLSKLNKLNYELKELGDAIKEENEILKAENLMREESIRIKQKTKLYHEIAQKLKVQLDALSEILEDLPDDEEEFRKQMKLACILNAYIKRYSNLLILAENFKEISSEELKLAFIESIEYIKNADIETFLVWNFEDIIQIEKALLMYEVFEAVIEKSLPTTNTVLVETYLKKGNMILSMQIDNPNKIFENTEMEILKKLNANLDIQYSKEENTQYLKLVFHNGGVV